MDTEYRYTQADRIAQLTALKEALTAFISVLAGNPHAPEGQVTPYQAALEQTDYLLANGFTQAELTALSDSVPDLFNRHPRDWDYYDAPKEIDASGRAVPAAWFVELERYLQPVLKAAGILRILGYYR